MYVLIDYLRKPVSQPAFLFAIKTHMRNLYAKAILVLIAFTVLRVNAQQADDNKILQLIRNGASQLQISATDAENAVISSHYLDPQTNIRYVYLQQAFKGISVFNTIKTIALRDENILYASGSFVPELNLKAGSPQPSLGASSAVSNAVRHLQLAQPEGLQIIEELNEGKKIIFNNGNVARRPIEVQLYWVAADDNSSVRLAWNVNIEVAGSADWWNVRVDAINGNIIEKDNWTVHEAAHQESHVEDQPFRFYNPPPPTVTGAGYFVVPFPYESPKHHSLVTENQPWMKAGAGNPATTNGWHFDGANNYNITRGNNVFAYLDLQNSNTPGGTSNFPDTSSTAIPSLSFGSVPSFMQSPAVPGNRKAAVTNLFYWNNIIHDVTYQYGFNEASGNFQADNMGRGGNGNDYVQAEAQDASGTNNANFSTPADGTRPRMQMYLFTGGPLVIVTAPSSIAGNYNSVESIFSTSNKLAVIGAVSGQVVYYNDAVGGTHEACGGAPTNTLTGKIALIDRGNCNFTDKVKAAQNAGAIGVIMINNVSGAAIQMGGTDNTITIPAVMVTMQTGAILVSAISNGLSATLSPPIGIDGDYDNGIVVHEYGHGVSNRLTGGPANSSCLSNAEQAGEGWSDYLTLMLTTNWATTQLTDGSELRPMGTYALNQPVNAGGIRTYPYSTDMMINPLTYANMANNTEVHFTGEIWCSALWDMTWNIIQQTGTIEPNLYNSTATAGNVIAFRLVMEGLRLQPCRPGFLDARNAILAADSILYNGAYKCAIWKAFAKRGMGASAKQGLSSLATDQVAAFDVPSAVFLSKAAAPEVVSPGSQLTINVGATCQCAVPSSVFTIRDTIPAGFSYVSSTGGTLNGNVVSFQGINFTSEKQTKNFTITIKAESNGCFIDTAINDNRTITTGGLTSSALSGTTQWISSSARSKSPAMSWLASTPTAASDFTLTSGQFSAGSLSVLSFWHYYVTEDLYDGGTVELSANNGTTWFDASPYMLQNGYNTVMIANGSWTAGQKSFSGVSYAQGSNQFINTVINLSSFNGQQLRVRFRMRTDAGNPSVAEGWFIDDILHMNGCGGIVKAGLYNASNIKIDSTAYPVFIRSNGVPTTILSQPAAATVCIGDNASYTVSAGGGTLTYQWQVSTNGGSNYTNINGATSPVLSISNVDQSLNGYLYRCIVDNGSNSAITIPAQLVVASATTVGSVQNVTVCETGSASFTSNATGSNLTYQWQWSTDGGNVFNNITAATAAGITINNVALSQHGSLYRVIVSGSCGGATSAPGMLSVNANPVVTITNAPANICTSDPAVSLVGSQPGGIWTGQGMSGDKFSPAGLQPGTYHVHYNASNALGCSSTASAVIVVANCANRQLLLDAAGAIILYPNPNNGRFSIKFNTERYPKLSMRVFASDGKLVDAKMISGITYGMILPVNLFHLASDVYQLSLYDEVTGMEKTFRLMIAR